MRDIALFRLTMALVLEQCELCYFIVLQSTLQTGTEDIKDYNAKADQDIMNHSVLNSIALTHGSSSMLTRVLTENGLHPLNFFLEEFYL